jgi:protein-S-isoprenylcysteine O-methyltransferase Ste14
MMGLYLAIPSIATLVVLVGIPGYYLISLGEEKLLLSHFGEDYELYMEKTGRFLPYIGRGKPTKDKTSSNSNKTKTVKSEV